MLTYICCVLDDDLTAAASPDATRPPEYYNYQLVGILIHRGVADSGHYYSFIRERSLDDGTTTDRWFEFNDDLVTPFDISVCSPGARASDRW